MMTTMRQAFRSLLREPLILGLSILALGLGIGLPTAMFSLVDATILRGLPVEDAGEVVHLERRPIGASGEGWGARPMDYVAWRDARSFESVAAVTLETVSLRAGAGAERWSAARMTASTFPLLRVEAAIGRVFTAEEERSGAAVVLLSDALWRDRFARDPGVLDRTVFVEGVARTVIGVMPPSFRFPADQDVWLPLPVDALANAGDNTYLTIAARLSPGVSREAARSEMAVVAQRMAQLDPEGHAGEEITVKSYTERFMGETATRQIYIVLGAVLLVLLIACVNVAGLLLVRAVRRASETAVHAALGAGRGQLIARLLTESVVLAALGGVAGTAVAWLALQGLAMLASDRLPYWVELRLDARVLLFAFGATALAAVLAGMLPALKATAGDLARAIYDAARGSTGLRVGRAMQALVVLQVALALALLVATGAMVRSIVRVQHDDLGLPGAEVAVARLALPETVDDDARRRFFAAVEADLRDEPGLAGVALATSVPATHGGWRSYAVEGVTYDSDDNRPSVRTAAVSPEFFAVFGATPLQGRAFDARDDADGLPVAIVTPKFAALHFDGEDALGRRLRVGDEEEWRTIVGVVPELWIGALDASPDRNPSGVYLPFAQATPAAALVTVRAARGAGLDLLPAVRAAVANVDPDVPVFDARSMTRVVADSGWHYGLVTSILAACGLSAMLLATVGLYGILAFSVGQRRREFGVRMAMGATGARVIGHVLRRGALQVGAGALLGFALAVVLTRALAGLLFEVSPGDPLVFIAAGTLLVVVAGAAMLVPAIRAARTQPLEALRAE